MDSSVTLPITMSPDPSTETFAFLELISGALKAPEPLIFTSIRSSSPVPRFISPEPLILDFRNPDTSLASISPEETFSLRIP